MIESKETNIEKTEPNIEAYRASSEAKQLRQLLESNTATLPNAPVRSSSFRNLSQAKKNAGLPPKPPKPDENGVQVSTENVNKLFNNMFQEIESAIEPDSNDIPVKPKIAPKMKPSVPSKPNSAQASPVPPKKKLPPPPVHSKPSIPLSAKPATPVKPATPAKPSTPTKPSTPVRPSTPNQESSTEKESFSSSPVKQSPFKKQAPPPSVPDASSAKESTLTHSTSIKKTTPPPSIPDVSANKESTLTHSTSIKKTLPPPPLPVENSESPVKKTLPPPPLPTEDNQQPVKKTLPPPPLPIDEENDDTSPTADSVTSPTSIMALQKKALMLKNTKKLAPPPPAVPNDSDNNSKARTKDLANRLSRSLSLNDGARNNAIMNHDMNMNNNSNSKTVPCTPTVSNSSSLPPFIQLPNQASNANTQDNYYPVPNLCEVTISEEQDPLMASLPSNNAAPKRNHSRRNHPVSMYAQPNKSSLPNPSSHYRARSSTSYSCKSESESIPESLRSFFNEQEINENEISFTNGHDDDSKNNTKVNEPVVAEKTNNRSFLFSKSNDQESKKLQRHQSRMSEVPDSMKLLFGGFGNVQELDSDSENESEFDENVNDNANYNTNNPIASTIIPEDSTDVIQKDDYTPPKIYLGSNKDKNCRNSSIINASIVPPNEPPIPSLDKKPYRGNTLRWVINVNC